jgi:hypothetical protein
MNHPKDFDVSIFILASSDSYGVLELPKAVIGLLAANSPLKTSRMATDR